MSSGILLLILMVAFFILIVFGVSIAISLLFSSLLVIILDPNLQLLIVPLRMFSGINNFVLLAVPGFMFAAFLMNRIGITDDVVTVADVMVGYIKGGLAHVNVVASMLFAGVSGASTADTAGIGAILIPAMNKQGYDRGFSAAITAASSTIGNIIPPSIFMVIYGSIAGVSIGGLFLAGIIPGVLVGLTQILYSYIYAKQHNYGTMRRFPVVEDILLAVRKGVWPFFLMIIILGGIIFGIYTATEAAAISAVYVLIIGLLVYRSLTWKKIMQTALLSATMTATVFFTVASATLFAWLMSYYNAFDPVVEFFSKYSSTSEVFLLYVIGIFVLLGTFMDPIPAMTIVVPIIVPVAEVLGVHSLLLGILVVMALCVGKITPPYGISLLVACGIAEIPVSNSLKPTSVLFIIFCLVMILVTFIPQLALVIPRAVMPMLFLY